MGSVSALSATVDEAKIKITHDDRRQSFDTSILDRNDERRRRRVRPSERVEQPIRVGRHKQSDDRDSEHVEQQNPPERPPDRLGERDSGVLGLSDGDREDLGSDERERGLDHEGPEGAELSPSTLDNGSIGTGELVEGAGVAPVWERVRRTLATSRLRRELDEIGPTADSHLNPMGSRFGPPPQSRMIPMMISPTMAMTLMAENQNSAFGASIRV